MPSLRLSQLSVCSQISLAAPIFLCHETFAESNPSHLPFPFSFSFPLRVGRFLISAHAIASSNNWKVFLYYFEAAALISDQWFVRRGPTLVSVFHGRLLLLVLGFLSGSRRRLETVRCVHV